MGHSNKISDGHYAIVTGASSGLGRCYAIELAKTGINTLLVALPGTGLEKVVMESISHGIKCIPFEADLCREADLQNLCEEINAKYPVFLLINNAGTGGTKSFSTCQEEYLRHMICLNITVPTMLIRLLLPNLRSAKEAFILNVSSMAAYSPIGFKTVYPASKRFVLHFSRGLREELRSDGISVSVVTPGPMKTNPDIVRRIERQGIFGRIGLLSPEQVAGISLKRTFRRKAVIIPGLSNKINHVLMSLIPDPILIRLMSRVISRELDSFNDFPVSEISVRRRIGIIQ